MEVIDLATKLIRIKVGSIRKVMKPFTFSNGLTIPVGQFLAAPSGGIHADDAIYENAREFDGFRFSRMREAEGESAKHHSVNTGTQYLVFGHGKHAWFVRGFLN